MRIYNLTTSKITLTDIDRGFAGDKDIYESWNTKTDNTIPVSGYVDVFDSERVMLSLELGQIKKHTVATRISTDYSITGRNVGPLVIDASNDTFIINVASVGDFTFTLPHGTAVSMADVVATLNATATGFAAEESIRFFRSSNTDNITAAKVDGDLSFGYGQRGPSIISGFLVLVSKRVITIKAGNANGLLGFTQGDLTRCM